MSASPGAVIIFAMSTSVSAGAAGRIEGLSLRLYAPEARQWNLNFSNARTGTLSPPVTGEFREGRGEFFGVDTLGSGRAILVRFVIWPVDARGRFR